MKILIATSNSGKFLEISTMLKSWGHEAVSLKDLDITEEVDEDQPTFLRNSFKKANFYCQLSGLPTIADDGGLIIPALNNEPGVKSRRWDGSDHMDDDRLLNYTLEKMSGLSGDQRFASLVTVVTLVYPDNHRYSCQAKVDGLITERQMSPIEPGYPFRSIFMVKKFNKVFSELTENEHAAINHRRRAVMKLREHLK